MKACLTLILSFFCISFCASQNKMFEKTLFKPSSNAYTTSYSIIPSGNDSYVYSINKPGFAHWRTSIAKMDTGGNGLWVTDLEPWFLLHSMTLGVEGSIYLTGGPPYISLTPPRSIARFDGQTGQLLWANQTSRSLSLFPAPNQGVFAFGGGLIAKIDSMGDTLWTRAYDAVNGLGFGSLAISSNGDFLFGGTSGQRGIVLRTDAAGTPIWAKEYGHVPLDSTFPENFFISEIKETQNGGILITGGVNYEIVPNVWQAEPAPFASLLDSAGDPIWSWVYRYSDAIISGSIETPGGGFIFSYSGAIGKIFGVDSSGNQSWIYKSNEHNFLPYGISVGSSNEVIFCGYGGDLGFNNSGMITGRFSLDGIGCHPPLPGDSSSLIPVSFTVQPKTVQLTTDSFSYSNYSLTATASLDSAVISCSHTPCWAHALQGPDTIVCSTDQVTIEGFLNKCSEGGTWLSSGTGTFFPNDVVSTLAFNDTVISVDYLPSSADTSLGLVKITLHPFGGESGVNIPDTMVLNFTHCSGGVNDTKNSVLIYPNPASEQLTISGQWASIPTVALFDMFGKERPLTSSQEGKDFIIDTSQLSSGLYILRIKDGKDLYSRKVLVE